MAYIKYKLDMSIILYFVFIILGPFLHIKKLIDKYNPYVFKAHIHGDPINTQS